MNILSLKRTKPRNLATEGARADFVYKLLPTDKTDKSSGPASRFPAENSRTKMANPHPAKIASIQNFSLCAPAASSVQLVGCFTNWQKRPISLRKWWTAVRLERGTYYYRFLVDGQWCNDPECPLLVPNPFGSLNAVRQVN